MAIPRWRLVSTEYDGHIQFQCLNCYQFFASVGRLEGWKFCPFCGLAWQGQELCREQGSPRWYPVTLKTHPWGTEVDCWPYDGPQPRVPVPLAEVAIQVNYRAEPDWETVRVFEFGHGFGTAFAAYLALRELKSQAAEDTPLPWCISPEYRLVVQPYQGRTYYPVNRAYCLEQLKELGVVHAAR